MFTNSRTSTPTVTMRDTHRGNSRLKKGEKERTTFFPELRIRDPLPF
jgi:hypothetical protein